MSSTEQAPEPTMDEILASIRRIIADDEPNEVPGQAAVGTESNGPAEGAPSDVANDILNALESNAESDQALDDILELTNVVTSPQPPASAAPETAADVGDAGILEPAAPQAAMEPPAMEPAVSPPPVDAAPLASSIDSPAPSIDSPPPSAPSLDAAAQMPAPPELDVAKQPDYGLPKIDFPVAPPPPPEPMPTPEAAPLPPPDAGQAEEPEDFAASFAADVEAALPEPPASSDSASAIDDVMEAMKSIETLAPTETQVPDVAMGAAETEISVELLQEDEPSAEQFAPADGAAPQPEAAAPASLADIEIEMPEMADNAFPADAPESAPVADEPLEAELSADEAGPHEATSAPRSLEDSVKQMLRPILREWLDDNMPRILEGAVKDELSGKGGSGRR